MKVTMYELLGLVKDGKVPKKIMFLGNTYSYDEIDKTYRNIIGNTNIGEMHNLEFYLDDEVEILEEEKKIPEKLGYFDLTKDKNEKDENGDDLELHYTGVADTFDDVYEKINEIIDYLDYLKSKGDE